MNLQDFLAEVADHWEWSEPPPIGVMSHDRMGDTPLHFACWSNNLEAVKLLLEAGANVNAKGEAEDTPLHVAVTVGNVTMVQFLLAHGASWQDIDAFGYTALQSAEQSQDADIRALANAAMAQPSSQAGLP